VIYLAHFKPGDILVGVLERNAGHLVCIVAVDVDHCLWDYVDAYYDYEEWVWRYRGGGNAPYDSRNGPGFEEGWQRVQTRRRILPARSTT
jgi:hypothetical protein